MELFKDRIKELRKNRGESQEVVGRAIGVSRYSIHLYEKGTCDPDLKGFIALAEHFQVSLDYLAGRTDNPEVNRRPPTPGRTEGDAVPIHADTTQQEDSE